MRIRSESSIREYTDKFDAASPLLLSRKDAGEIRNTKPHS